LEHYQEQYYNSSSNWWRYTIPASRNRLCELHVLPKTTLFLFGWALVRKTPRSKNVISSLTILAALLQKLMLSSSFFCGES
jgi:hypothetical protein